jgi:hypothetical protein
MIVPMSTRTSSPATKICIRNFRWSLTAELPAFTTSIERQTQSSMAAAPPSTKRETAKQSINERTASNAFMNPGPWLSPP